MLWRTNRANITALAGVAKTILVRLLVGLGGCALVCAAIPFEPINLRCAFTSPDVDYSALPRPAMPYLFARPTSSTACLMLSNI